MPFLTDLLAIPVKTDRTLRHVPYVTYALCFINIFVFLALVGKSNSDIYHIEHHWGFIVAHPRLYTLFTAAFLHVEWEHLAGNLLILWLVGTVLEAGIGSAVFLLLYLASQVFATTLHGLISRVFMPETITYPLFGASGAIAGVTGLAAFRYYKIRVAVILLPVFALFRIQVPFPIPVIIWVPMWTYAAYFISRDLYYGFLQLLDPANNTGVAHWAHIGGLIVGVLVAIVMQVASEGRREFALEDSARAAKGSAPRERSLKELQELLREHPNDPEIIEAMAGLLMVQGEHEKSRDLYLKAVRLFLKTSQRDRAAISYLNVLHTFPSALFQPREQITLASSLEAQGHFREAVQAFTLIIEQYPDREEAQTALLRAAQLYQRYLNDRENAERMLNLFLDRYPDSHWRRLAQERLRELTQ